MGGPRFEFTNVERQATIVDRGETVHKQAHIHVHALLVEVARHLMREEGMPVEAIARYDAHATGPASLHATKGAHQEAIALLLADIESWLERERATEPAETVDRQAPAHD